jgi:hypothetical protein
VSQAEIDYLKLRRDTLDKEISQLEARLSISNRLKENEGFTRSPSVIIDPLTGNLIDIEENSKAIRQLQAEREAERNAEYQAFLQSRKQFEGFRQPEGVILDPITGSLINLSENAKALQQLQAERDAARNSEYQAFLQSRKQFEGFRQEDGLIYDPISQTFVNLNEQRAQLEQFKIEQEIEERKARARAGANLSIAYTSSTYGANVELNTFQKNIDKTLEENEALLERLTILEDLGALSKGDFADALDVQKDKLEAVLEPLKEGTKGWIAIKLAIQDVIEKLKEVKTYAPAVTRDDRIRFDDFTTDLINGGSGSSVLGRTPKKTLDDRQAAFSQIDAKALALGDSMSILGEGIDVAGLKAQATKQTIIDLIEQGYDPQSETIKNLMKDYEKLTAEQKKYADALNTMNNILGATQGIQAFADGIKNRESNPLGVVEGFGSGLAGIANFIPGIGPIASQFIKTGTSFVTGFVGMLQSIFDPTKEQRDSLANSIGDSFKSGIQSAINAFRNGDISLEEFEISVKQSAYDALFQSSLSAFVDAAFQSAGLAPLFEEIAQAVISGNDSALDDAFAKFDAYINSPEWQKFVDTTVEISKRFPKITNNPSDPKALQPTLVAPLQSIDAGVDWSDFIAAGNRMYKASEKTEIAIDKFGKQIQVFESTVNLLVAQSNKPQRTHQYVTTR